MYTKYNFCKPSQGILKTVKVTVTSSQIITGNCANTKTDSQKLSNYYREFLKQCK